MAVQHCLYSCVLLLLAISQQCTCRFEGFYDRSLRSGTGEMLFSHLYDNNVDKREPYEGQMDKRGALPLGDVWVAPSGDYGDEERASDNVIEILRLLRGAGYDSIQRRPQRAGAHHLLRLLLYRRR